MLTVEDGGQGQDLRKTLQAGLSKINTRGWDAAAYERKAIRERRWIGCDKVEMGQRGSTSMESAAISSTFHTGAFR